MEEYFKKDLSDIFQDSIVTFSIKYVKGNEEESVGRFPSSFDYYYKLFQSAIYKRYHMARKSITCCKDKNISFEEKEYKYEMALFYYNMVFELSWSWLRVIINPSNEKYITEMLEKVYDCKLKISDIDTSKKHIEEIEKTNEEPVSKHEIKEELQYAKALSENPNAKRVILFVENFNKDMRGMKIRTRYNKFKHRNIVMYTDDPNYSEGKPIKIYKDNKELLTSIKYLLEVVKLENCIDELILFDNEHLTNYIKKLDLMLKEINQP